MTTSFAAASAAERLAQHAERFADTRGIAKGELKDAACLLRRECNFQPLFRLLRQGAIFSAAIESLRLLIGEMQRPAGPTFGFTLSSTMARRHRVSSAATLLLVNRLRLR